MPFNGTRDWPAYQSVTPYPIPQNRHDHSNHQSQISQHYQLGGHNPLNPSVSSFQPTGTEMQRYQLARPPTPPSSHRGNPHEVVQMRNLMLENHFHHTKEFAALERKTKDNSEDLKSMREIVQNDMRALQMQIVDLKEEIQNERQQNGMLTRAALADQDLTPPNEFTQNFSKDKIAEAYLDQAEDYELTAAKLREQAEEISTGINSLKPSRLKLLANLNGANGSGEKAEYTCCGNLYDSLREMLEHVGKEHSLNIPGMTRQEVKQDAKATMNGGGDTTPTHVPPHRRTADKDGMQSHAVNIKAADGGDDEKTPTQEVISTGVEATRKNKSTQTEEIAKFIDTGTQTNDKDLPLDFPLSSKADSSTKWIPLGVRDMPATAPVATGNKETFTFDFLKMTLGGEEWSPGFYYIKNSKVHITTYWLLESEFEPHLPTAPGQHGAKLTAFWNKILPEPGQGPQGEEYDNVPVFISTGTSKNTYTYYGNYSQTRYSDKLDVDHLLDNTPEAVLHHHAEELSNLGRPEWLTRELMEHFWPMPIYNGPMPTNSQICTPTSEATVATDFSVVPEKRVLTGLNAYIEELKGWEREAKMKAMHLTTNELMQAFRRADAEEPPSLRLWLEYLECVGYDQGFYEFLKKGKSVEKPMAVPVGGKMVSAKGEVETVHPTPAAVWGVTGKKKESQRDEHGGTKSAVTAVKAKPHTDLKKPWEESKEKRKMDNGTVNGNGKPQAPNGDINAAKQLQSEFKKAKDGAKPPHKRSSRGK